MGALPAALRVALLAGVLAGVAEGRIKAAANQVYFGVLSDWGGQTDMPYTTPGQVRSRVTRAVLGSRHLWARGSRAHPARHLAVVGGSGADEGRVRE